MTESNKKSSHEHVLKEWLAEFKSLPKASLSIYAKSINEKNEVMEAFRVVLIQINDATLLQLVQPSCHQLFEFYRTGPQELKTFAISLFPAAVGAYLSICTSLHESSNQLKLSIETFLLSIYNLLCAKVENISPEAVGSESGIEIPNIVNSSLYHDPMSYPFSERTMNMPNSSRIFAKFPTITTYNCIIPANRSKILYTIMSSYVDHIAVVSKCSLSQLCAVCLRLGCVGFPWQKMFLKSQRLPSDRRAPVEPDLSIVLLRSLNFALYNGYRSDASKAVQAMQKRSKYELHPNVLLLCNAILNSVFHEKGKISHNSPLGLCSAATPMMTRTSSKVLKHAVTAKSIKHHKWQHTNEEVSGDITDSILQDASMVKEGASANFEPEDASSKPVKPSPTKILKSKLKKSTPTPSAGSPGMDKPRSLSIPNEKKKKRVLPTKLSEEPVESDRSRTPSGGQPSDFIRPVCVPSTSVPSLKQANGEEQSTRAIDRSDPLSKSLTNGEDSSHNLLPTEGNTGKGSKKAKSDKGKNKSNHKANKDSEMKEFKRSASISKTGLDGQQQEGQETRPLLDNSNEEDSVTVTTQM